METHHFLWINQLFLWHCSIAIYVCLPGRATNTKNMDSATIIPVGFPSHQELTNGKKLKSSANPAFCREFSLDLSDSSNQTMGT